MWEGDGLQKPLYAGSIEYRTGKQRIQVVIEANEVARIIQHNRTTIDGQND